jgi:hypothetical protein
MIEGLKVTVEGKELYELCWERSNWHADRALLYRNQALSMEQNQLEGMTNTSAGSPIEQLKEKARSHESNASEMKFIAEHIVPTEHYVLDGTDLVKLGIAKSRY